MPPPTSPPNKLLETILEEVLRADLFSRGSLKLAAFLGKVCTPQEMDTLTSEVEVFAMANLKLQHALKGPLINLIARTLIKTVLQMAADKAQMIYVNDNPPCSEGVWEVNKNAILEIEKLFF